MKQQRCRCEKPAKAPREKKNGLARSKKGQYKGIDEKRDPRRKQNAYSVQTSDARSWEEDRADARKRCEPMQRGGHSWREHRQIKIAGGQTGEQQKRRHECQSRIHTEKKRNVHNRSTEAGNLTSMKRSDPQKPKQSYVLRDIK